MTSIGTGSAVKVLKCGSVGLVESIESDIAVVKFYDGHILNFPVSGLCTTLRCISCGTITFSDDFKIVETSDGVSAAYCSKCSGWLKAGDEKDGKQ